MAPSMDSLSIEQQPGPVREVFGGPRRAFGLGALTGFFGVGLAVAALSHLGALGPQQGTKFTGAPVVLQPTHLRAPPAASKTPVKMAMPAGDAGTSRRAVLGAAGLAVASQVLGKPAEVGAATIPTLVSSNAEGELWKFYPDFEFSGKSKDEAMADFLDAANNKGGKYKVTQEEIDQGGFKVFTQAPNYVYLQLGNGLGRDDIVAAEIGEGKVTIRSDSRQGEWDKKFVSYLASELNSKPGWKCPQV
eukprot:CAMPEP_0179230250 /NCGR_PEP_ID=MMETSP0797-20121207/10742_1 /TAXON_ID=47934 /ORGANISM="Dinophysis acuminata, Strain DAEP01" /LENGTH=246 /DNA_ID=CAMNT_0020937323 /DNA_START=15 /DNA_END=755 /DNA_ORIENTATION=+